MTVLLVCGKKSLKKYKSEITKVNAYNLVATITLVKSNIVKSILEHNTHILVWIDDVEFKKDTPDYQQIISELRTTRPGLKIKTVEDFGGDSAKKKEAIATLLPQMATPESVKTAQDSGVDVFAEYLTERDGAFDFDKIVMINC
jgi:hypothetical protein